MVPSWISTKRTFVFFTMLLSLSSILIGQSERGTISGTVRDSSGAVIPQAKVNITNVATGQPINLVTNDSGDFTAAEVPVGTYNIQFVKEGFNSAEVENLKVDAASSLRADISLQIGQSQQIVEVQATALQVNREDSKVSVTVDQRLVDSLPLVVA
ncbi:MAG: carboxypeptidase regulatory-like domain-containing protein [Acidobacteriaceae bacterium]|nr:carboxypeptidase regulatory-like domain-containing protein [Acidobacteriaceae bacterium]